MKKGRRRLAGNFRFLYFPGISRELLHFCPHRKKVMAGRGEAVVWKLL